MVAVCSSCSSCLSLFSALPETVQAVHSPYGGEISDPAIRITAQVHQLRELRRVGAIYFGGFLVLRLVKYVGCGVSVNQILSLGMRRALDELSAIYRYMMMHGILYDEPVVCNSGFYIDQSFIRVLIVCTN